MAFETGQISLRQILTNMGYGTVANVGVQNVNGIAMGAFPANPGTANNQRYTSSLCMPYERNVVASLGANGTIAPNANWSASTTNFRDNRLSEFRASSTGTQKPNVYQYFVTKTTRTSTYSFTFYARGSISGSNVYYFKLSGPGTISPSGASWSTAGNNIRNYSITGGYYRAVYTVSVQDYWGCGNKNEFFGTIQYT